MMPYLHYTFFLDEGKSDVSIIGRDKNRSNIIMSIYEQAGSFIYYSYKACIVEHISFSGIWCYFNPDSWYRLATTILLYD